MNSCYWQGVLCVALLVTGCREPFGCTGIWVPAIVVTVTDSVTGDPTAEGAFGAIREGSYIDSLRPSAYDGEGRLISLQAGGERPGTYAVVVGKSGYETWLRVDVQVESNQCHVETVALEARLKRLP